MNSIYQSATEPKRIIKKHFNHAEICLLKKHDYKIVFLT
jgi:hypothetical protein